MSHSERKTDWKAEGSIRKRGVVRPPTSASFGAVHRHDGAKVSKTSGDINLNKLGAGKRKEPSFPRREQPRKMQQTAQRHSLSKGELQIKLQTLFRDKPQWTLTELQRTLNQPLQHLKENMKDICTFNSSLKAYELKSEYLDAV